MKIPKTLPQHKLNTQKHFNSSAGLSGSAPIKGTWIFLLLAGVSLFFFTPLTDAQLIQIEFLPGNNKVNFNNMISTSPSEGSFHFMNITIFDRYHNPENEQFNGGINHSYLYWNVTGRLGAGPAVTFHPTRGILPKIGFQNVYITDRFFFRIGPAVAYDERMNLELLINASHSVPVYQNWQLITGFRSMHNYAGFRYHGRSIHQFRIGLASRTYSYGIANEINQYGPNRITKWNTGLFIRHNIF